MFRPNSADRMAKLVLRSDIIGAGKKQEEIEMIKSKS
jgi:hypothetical protein